MIEWLTACETFNEPNLGFSSKLVLEDSTSMRKIEGYQDIKT